MQQKARKRDDRAELKERHWIPAFAGMTDDKGNEVRQNATSTEQMR
jgi:hypothetical protein